MRSILYLAVSAFAALAAAADNPFNIPSHGYDFTAGSATTLSWKPTTSGTVTLKLQWGSVTPTSGEVIACECDCFPLKKKKKNLRVADSGTV